MGRAGFESKPNKPRTKKNRQTKSVLVFDEKLRADYLTGFRKRKEERKRVARENEIEQLKEEKRRIKREKRESRLNELRDLGLDPEASLLASAPAETFDLPGHTVTITDVAEVDLTERMLGFNQGENSEEESHSKGRGSNEKDSNQSGEGKKKKQVVGKKRHKNLTHLMDVKKRARKHDKHTAAARTKLPGGRTTARNRRHRQKKPQ